MSMDDDVLQDILENIRAAIERSYAGDPSPVAINIDGAIVTLDADGMDEIREPVTVFVTRGELAEEIKRFISAKLGRPSQGA